MYFVGANKRKNTSSTNSASYRGNSKPKSLTKQFSPPPLPIIGSKQTAKSTIKTENYEDDLPPPPPPPPQAAHTSQEQRKQALILDYQDPINIHYDINSTNLQFILPINVEGNLKSQIGKLKSALCFKLFQFL